MANKKKKKKKKGQQQFLSPERFMREKARTLPIGKCYITPNWEDNGIANIIVTRIRPSGNLVVGMFLVDTFCLGVKDALFNHNMTPDEYADMLENFEKGPGCEEISYNEAHNLIYGSIAFAEEGGIKPHKDFKLAQYVLEEDTDDIPLIEYEFGKNGKHFLVVNENIAEMRHLKTLQKKLGDNFEYIVPYVGDFDDYDFTDLEEEDFDDEQEDKETDE